MGRAAMFKNKNMNISDLISSGANVAITITPLDLKEFATSLIERAQSVKTKDEPERYLSPDETAKKLGVTTNTLWRWNKSKYLCPVKVGHRCFYKLSDINKKLEG
jgi:lipoate-protein ligase A